MAVIVEAKGHGDSTVGLCREGKLMAETREVGLPGFGKRQNVCQVVFTCKDVKSEISKVLGKGKKKVILNIMVLRCHVML